MMKGINNRRMKDCAVCVAVAVLLFGEAMAMQAAQVGAAKSSQSAASQSSMNATNLLSPTPPMGWNSWDSYGFTVDEKEFKANAEWMAKNLKKFGWKYVVIDEGWFLQNPASGGKPAWIFDLDNFSRYVPDVPRYPSASGGAGFKPLADYVHSLGLKFGLHIVRGISREAVAKNLPIANSTFHAADAADTSDACPWNSDNYGIKDNAAGQAFYNSLARQYAGWGLDFLKIDCISSHPYKKSEIRQISTALKKAGRPIVLSLSPGPTSLANADEVRKYAQLWRISDDFWDYWDHSKDKENSWSQTLFGQMATASAWAPYIGPGRWPDADMLPLGFIGPHPGLGEARQTRLTHDEQRTLMTFWSIIRSPLIFGGNLTQNDEWTTALLTNPEVIAVNQHSAGNRPLIVTNSIVIWSAHPADGKGIYLAVINRGDEAAKNDIPWSEVGLASGRSYNIRDLWERKDLGGATFLKLNLPPHACVLYRVTSAE